MFNLGPKCLHVNVPSKFNDDNTYLLIHNLFNKTKLLKTKHLCAFKGIYMNFQVFEDEECC